MEIREVAKFEIDPIEVEAHLTKLKNQEAVVTIAGEFSSGKSTFLNALIGKEKFLPESLKECTPVLIDLLKSDSNQMGLVFQDGSTKVIEKDKDSIEKYARYTKEYDESIRMITVPVDSPYLPENVHFVDTPGSNTSIKKHEEIANYIIGKSDVVLYVVNKTMNATDLERLRYIQKYTNDIVIIISHIDETGNGDSYISQATIERLVQEVRDNVKEVLGMDEVDIFPIGSVQALKDDTYIAPIRECINEYIEENSAQMMKKRTEKQLSLVFEKKERELKQQIDLLLLGLESEQEDIAEKLEGFEKKLNRLEENKTTRLSRFKEMAEQQKTILNQELKTFVGELKEKTLNELTTKEVSEKEISEIFLKANEELSRKIVQLTEQKINHLLQASYQEMNDELKGILESLNINISLEVAPPKLEQLEFEMDQTKVSRLAKTKEQYQLFLGEVEKEIATADEQNLGLLEEKKRYEQQLQEVIRQMRTLGDYQPVFEEVVMDGGGSFGSKFGRFVGEVADIALIFYNPAGGAAAAADATKDAAKIGSFVNKAMKGKKAVEQVKKVKNVADEVLKIKEVAEVAGKEVGKLKQVADKAKFATEVLREEAGTIKEFATEAKETVEKVRKFDQLVAKRKEALEKLEEYKEQLPEEKQKSVLDLLDLLSLGYWGEKLGQSVGEAVKPTNKVFEENEAIRQEWEQNRKIIEQSVLELRLKIESIEREISQADSIKDKRRLKLQYEERVERQNQLIEESQKQLEKEKAFNIKREIEAYYENQVNQLFDAQLSNIQKEVNVIMEYASEEVEKNYRNQLDNEIDKLKANVVSLQKSKEELELEVKKKQALIDELAQYPSWIQEWTVAYGDC